MYVQVAILGNVLDPLTYHTTKDIKLFSLVTVTLSKIKRKGIVVAKVDKPDFKCLEVLGVDGEFFSPQQARLARFISSYYISSLGEAFGLFHPHTKNTKTKDSFFKQPQLSSKQKELKKEIDTHEQCLLFGDTGSGKTEIYISLMADALKDGKNIIFLMPEISLTPQIQKRLNAHFKDQVAIWHSKISKKRKEQILQGIANGDIKIIAGARSVLFLPLKNIGLIVVDEEHDDSYKSSQKPRYNAKNLALVYGKILEAKVILGSATPSLESLKYLPTIRLKGTHFKSEKHYIFENAINQITPMLLYTIEQNLKNDKQVIFFVPTRANYKYVSCKNCNEVVTCPFCDVSLSLHKQLNHLRCHYCNYTSMIPKLCPACNSQMLATDRIGTQEVCSSLKKSFPDKKVAIFDKDNVKTTKALNKLLKEFNEGDIDILVGTQMLSKGHDYHKVGLSVILGLDYIFFMPDFRAREKALGLCLQIAGRSGRKGYGEVYIQTSQEEFFKRYIDDYDSFLNEEMQLRQELYPPHKKLLKLEISHKNENLCAQITDKLVKTISSIPLDVQIVGYGKSNIEKIASKYRYEILLRSTEAKPLIQTALICKENFVQADMDPLSFS